MIDPLAVDLLQAVGVGTASRPLLQPTPPVGIQPARTPRAQFPTKTAVERIRSLIEARKPFVSANGNFISPVHEAAVIALRIGGLCEREAAHSGQ